MYSLTVTEKKSNIQNDAVMYICIVFMNLIILTVLVKIDASDIVMINHVLHDYAERVSNAA